MKTRRWYTLTLALSLLLVVTLACSVGGAKKAPEGPPAAPEDTPTSVPAPTVPPAPTEKTPAEEAPPEQAAPTTKPTLPPDTPTPEPTTEEAPAAEPTPEAEEPAPEPTGAAEPVIHDTVFPLPDDVQNLMTLGDEGQINYQTSLSMEEVIEFYRQEFAAMGLTERSILTVIEEDGFSLVFDGWENGKSVVLQGVDLGETVNVNLRFEDV